MCVEELQEMVNTHREEAEAKDIHCTFLQDQLGLMETSLSAKEKEANEMREKLATMMDLHSSSLDLIQLNQRLASDLKQKDAEIDDLKRSVRSLEEDLLQKDGTIIIMKESIKRIQKQNV